MDRRRVGSRGLTNDLQARAREWAERSCVDQQLPLKITDMGVLSTVASLLGVASTDRWQAQDTRSSNAPDRLEAIGIEAVVASPSGADDYVIEHGGDDRALTGEGKI